MTWEEIPINHKIILSATMINLIDHKEMKKNKMIKMVISIYSMTLP